MIPKTIHYCWIGEKSLPKSAKKCIKSWKKYCPDYQIIEWNESNYDFTQNLYMKEAYEAKKWGFVPDYARLDIIYKYGGIYLDTDVELLKPLDDLLSLGGFAGFEAPDRIALGLGFGAEANNPLIGLLRDEYNSLHFVDSSGNLSLIPAPIINTEVFEREGVKLDGKMQTVEGIKFFPPEYFCPRVGYGGKRHITENTYSDHHFDASWADKASKKKWAEESKTLDGNKFLKIKNKAKRLKRRIVRKWNRMLKNDNQ